MSLEEYSIDHRLDACGLVCPEPVMMLHKTMRKAKPGECIEVTATDPSTRRDIPNFCHFLGHELLLQEESADVYVYHLRKGG